MISLLYALNRAKLQESVQAYALRPGFEISKKDVSLAMTHNHSSYGKQQV